MIYKDENHFWIGYLVHNAQFQFSIHLILKADETEWLCSPAREEFAEVKESFMRFCIDNKIPNGVACDGMSMIEKLYVKWVA